MAEDAGFHNIIVFHYSDFYRKEVDQILEKEKINIFYSKNEVLRVEDWWKELQPNLILAEYDHELNELYNFIIKDLEIPLIIVADVKNERDVYELVEAGAYDYLFKDRLNKLPLIINNLIKKQNPVVTGRNEMYQSIFENSFDGILLTMTNGQILAANPSACRMFQMTEEEICKVGRCGIVDTEHPSHIFALEERERTGKVKAEVLMKKKDGSRFPAEVTSSVFKTSHGEEHTSIIIRDISESKIANDKIQASKEKYKQLFENSPLPSIIYDLNNLEIVEVNFAATNYYDYTRKEFLNLSISDFLQEEEMKKLKYFLQNEEQEEEKVQRHRMFHIKNGNSLLAVETYGYPLEYKDRKCRLVICLDVSERERNLDQIKQKSLQLEAAQQIAKIGYWFHDLGNDDFYWSDEVFKIWEREKECFNANLENFTNTIHPDDLQKFNEANAKAKKGEQDLDFEHRIITPCGKIKWVHERGKLTKNRLGKDLFEGTVQDITERKETLKKLIQAESRQRGILKSQTNYLIRTDLEGNYSYCNEKFINDFSWIFPDNELIGKYAGDTIHEYNHDRVLKTFEECVANPNTVYQVEIDKLQKDGGAKTTLWDFICLIDAKEKPIEVQCVGIDITDRVKTEKSLQESNTRNELVLKATSDAIYDWNCKTGEIGWSEGYNKNFGYDLTQNAPNFNDWTNNIHPDDYGIVENLFKAIEGEDDFFMAEYRYKKANGEFAYVVERGTIVRDQNGKALRMVGAIQDVTEKRKLEELLGDASKFARIGSFEINCEKSTMYWSPVTREIHDVDLSFVPTLKNGILFYKEGESRDAMNSAYLGAIEENKSYDLELQIITAKGKERWVRKIGRPTFVNGKCVRINGSFQDITNIKNSELRALKASEEKEVILESIGDAFFAVDNEWTVTYYNNHAERLLETTKNQVLGRYLWEVFPDTVDTKFYSSYHKAAKEQTIEDFEEYFERVKRWFDVTVYPSKNGLSVYFRDVTIRKESELQIIELNKNLKAYTEELVAANKGLEQFSYIISHNLRAPVANIIGLGGLMQDDFPPEVKMKFQEELFSNVKRLDTIIKDLNDILQVKVDMSEKKEPVELDELVDFIKLGIDQVMQKENVEIITDFSEVPVLHSIRTYLHSVFYNLIFNSIKYRHSERTPVLKIRSRQEQEKVIIIFEDNGVGIDLDKRGSEIFGLYKRFHHHVEGKGMGLFMVKTQVELMGGKIEVMSQVDEGSVFTIEFIENNKTEDLKNEEAATIYCD